MYLKNLFIICLIAFIISFTGCKKDKTISPEENIPPDIAWLQENILPFDTEMPGSGYEDLMPLKEIIGDARIVALGETSHGTKECFLIKHRLLEFLVEEMNFNVFAIEADFCRTLPIMDYVEHGTGDASEALKNNGYWVWKTQEVLNLITWMREYNENSGNTKAVSFYGFDLVYFDEPADYVIKYLNQVDPSAVSTAFNLFQSLKSERNSHADESVKNSLKNDFNTLLNYFIGKKNEYESLTSSKEYLIAMQCLKETMQNVEMVWNALYIEDFRDPMIYETRDRYMAENVEWILEDAEPGSKAVLWAHNFHVSTEYPSMGYNLRQKYSDEIVIVGMTFNKGSFNAYGYDLTLRQTTTGIVVPFTVPQARKGSYAWCFSQAGISRFFLDFRKIKTGQEETLWFSIPHYLRYLDAIYDPTEPDYWYFNYKANDLYDVMIFFESTSPSTLLPN